MAFGGIGVPARDQPLDQRDHLLDVLGGAGLDARRQAAKRGDVGVELRRGALRQLTDRDAFLGGARVDLVVNVGDVARVDHMVRAVNVAQQPEQHVERR